MVGLLFIIVTIFLTIRSCYFLSKTDYINSTLEGENADLFCYMEQYLFLCFSPSWCFIWHVAPDTAESLQPTTSQCS